MKYQALAYVQRKRITDWKRLVLRDGAEHFLYGSNDNHLFSKLPPGSILWVIASVPKSSPELVAKLVIDEVFPISDGNSGLSKAKLWHFREFKWIAKASDQSVFFGHNSASNALVRTIFENAKGEPWSFSERNSTWLPSFGRSLQRPRKIYHYAKTNGALELEKLESQASKNVFISWKWRDHKHSEVIALAKALANNGIMTWLDKLALPASRALDKVAADHIQLEYLLQYGYRNCKYLLALDSPYYGIASPNSDKNWTLREWEGEISPDSRPFRICVRDKDKQDSTFTSSADLTIDSDSAEEIVAAIKALS